MEPITSKLNCEQSEFYAVGDVAWGSCRQQLPAFYSFSPRYTDGFVDTALAELAAAESIPGAQARAARAEIVLTQVAEKAEKCRNEWQKLKRYITKSVPKAALKASLEAAGSLIYEKAGEKNWDKVRALNTAGYTYVVDNEAALLTNDNMAPGFMADYQLLKNEFAVLYTEVLDARETAKQGTQQKVIANNNAFEALMDMMLDGQQIFKDDPAAANQFIFTEVLKEVSSAGQAGVKGLVLQENGEVIAGAIISILDTDKEGTSDESGNYEIKPVPNGTYSIRVTAEGYEPQLIEAYKIKLGTVSTLDVVMMPIMES